MFRMGGKPFVWCISRSSSGRTRKNDVGYSPKKTTRQLQAFEPLLAKLDSCESQTPAKAYIGAGWLTTIAGCIGEEFDGSVMWNDDPWKVSG